MAADLVPVPLERPLQEFEPSRWHATRQVLFVFFKWQRLIIGLFLAFTVAAGIAMYLKPKAYLATSKVLLKGDRVSLQISGLAPVSGKLGYSAQMLQSELELMRSRVILLPVAQKILARNRTGQPGPADGAADGAIEETIETLQENLVRVALPESNVIQVSYLAGSPAAAEETLRLILDQYLEQQMVAQGGSGKIVDFYEQEKHRVEGGLKVAEERLANWKKANNVVSIDEEITRQLGVTKSLEESAYQTEAQIQSTKSRIATLTQQRSTVPTHLVASQERIINPLVTTLRNELAQAEVALSNVDNDPLVAKLKTDLVTAEVALGDLLQRYTENDRRVQEKREQIVALGRKLTATRAEAELVARKRIAELKQQLQLTAAQKEETLLGTATTTMHPIREMLDKELAVAQALLPSLLSQRDAVTRQMREAGAALAVLRENQHEAERLSRAQTFGATALKLADQKLEEARLAAGLDREQLGNVVVIEQPHPVPYGAGSRRLGMVVLAAIVGLALGSTIAFGYEFFNNSVRTREDAEYYIGLPVLATIPELEGGRRLALER